MLYLHCGGLSIHVVCLNKLSIKLKLLYTKKRLNAAETLDISKCCDRLYSVSNLIENSGPHPHVVSEISDIVTSCE